VECLPNILKQHADKNSSGNKNSTVYRVPGTCNTTDASSIGLRSRELGNKAMSR
jgi:hypothetical protein